MFLIAVHLYQAGRKDGIGEVAWFLRGPDTNIQNEEINFFIYFCMRKTFEHQNASATTDDCVKLKVHTWPRLCPEIISLLINKSIGRMYVKYIPHVGFNYSSKELLIFSVSCLYKVIAVNKSFLCQCSGDSRGWVIMFYLIRDVFQSLCSSVCLSVPFLQTWHV